MYSIKFLFVGLSVMQFETFIFWGENENFLDPIQEKVFKILLNPPVAISIYSITILLLEAQLLSNYIDTTDSLPHSLPHGKFSRFGHIFVVCGSIWTFFKDLLPRI